MSHTLTPVPQYDAAAITMPDNGDANTIDSIEAPMQKIADRAQHAVNGVASRIAWAETISVEAGGSNSSFTINVGAIQAIVLARVDGSYRAYSANAAAIGASKLESGSTLSNSSWYYVYAFDNAGVVDFQISITAPRASGVYKNTVGNVYRYLGCFRTNGSGAPIPSRAVRGVTTYLQGIPTGYVSLSGPTTGYEAISLAALVPPHSRNAIADISVTGDGRWRCIGDAGYDATPDRSDRAIVLDASQQIEWSSASSGGITVTVRGYSA